MLAVNNISYRIPSRALVNDISFTVKAGEMLVVLGANGAGKSTLLKMLTGELKPSAGNIHIHNQELGTWKHTELAKIRAVLQQQTIVSLPFAVKDVVLMGRYPHFNGHETPNDIHIVNSAMAESGITHMATRSYLTLSGGEQQRVHLARVFAQVWPHENARGACLLMDEPLNNLDIQHQHKTLQMAQAYARRGNAVIAVLHDLNTALQYADTVLLLKQGDAVVYGKPNEVLTSETLTHAFDYPMHVSRHAGYSHNLVFPSAVVTGQAPAINPNRFEVLTH